jgi:GntR family transcriptional regulator, transcriptional repressor for pyruvate dehydrogenase complex
LTPSPHDYRDSLRILEDEPTEFDLIDRRKPKAAEILAADFRHRILSRNLQPGDPLPPEAQIIAQSGLSRATVREALRLLESEGLVEVKRGARGGITVGRPSASHVARSLALVLTTGEATWRELFAFRRLVEPTAAAGAAEHADREQRQQLVKMAKLDDERHSHPAFHVAIAEASGNAILGIIVPAIEQAVHWLSVDEDLTEWDIAGAANAHAMIAEAVAKGDTRKAERTMLRHLDAFQAAAADKDMLDRPLLPRAHWSSRTRNRLGTL